MKSDRHTDYLVAFGENLKRIREKKGVSQEILAYESELSISQISRIERGVISTSLSQIVSISHALGLKPKDLFKFEV